MKITRKQIRRILREFRAKPIEIELYLKDIATSGRRDGLSPGAIKMMLQDEFMDNFGSYENILDYEVMIDNISAGLSESKLRKIIREQMKSWAERKAEMDAWEKKLVAVLPEDPSDLSDADITNIAQVFIDEYGLDQADAFFEDDRGTLADLGVPTYPDLEDIRLAITMAQDKERTANISKSPDKKELQAIDAGLEPREVAYLTYQPIRRGGKVVAFEIEDSETPFGTMPLGHSTFVVDERDAKGAGTTIDKIIKMLEKGGATLRKRRKPVKRSTPYYD